MDVITGWLRPLACTRGAFACIIQRGNRQCSRGQYFMTSLESCKRTEDLSMPFSISKVERLGTQAEPMMEALAGNVSPMQVGAYLC